MAASVLGDRQCRIRADATDLELAQQVAMTKHRERVTEAALDRTANRRSFLVDDATPVRVANAYAAEHLEVNHSRGGGRWRGVIRAAGAIFRGRLVAGKSAR